MKITARKTGNNIPIIDVEILTDHPFFHSEYFPEGVAAAYNPEDVNLPKRPVISKDKNRIEQWMIDDFEAFVEDVETLCEVNYGLVLTYSNVSKDHSHYYNYLAKDEEGNVIVKFRLRLRVSNHPPKRSLDQKKNKKAELLSEKLNELLSKGDIKKLRTYTKIITVNDEYYDSYDEAFEEIDQLLEEAVAKMQKGK